MFPIRNLLGTLTFRHFSFDISAAEQFKKISIAYAVLSDPNKRRQYDLSGPSGAIVDFEGIDISEMGGVGMFFFFFKCIPNLVNLFSGIFNKFI